MNPLQFPGPVSLPTPSAKSAAASSLAPLFASARKKIPSDQVRFSGTSEDAGKSGKLANFGKRVLQGLGFGFGSALNLRSLLWGAAMGALFGGIVSIIPGGLFFSPVMIPIGMVAWAGVKFAAGFAAGAAIHPDDLREVLGGNRSAVMRGDAEKLAEALEAAMKRRKGQ